MNEYLRQMYGRIYDDWRSNFMREAKIRQSKIQQAEAARQQELDRLRDQYFGGAETISDPQMPQYNLERQAIMDSYSKSMPIPLDTKYQPPEDFFREQMNRQRGTFSSPPQRSEKVAVDKFGPGNPYLTELAAKNQGSLPSSLFPSGSDFASSDIARRMNEERWLKMEEDVERQRRSNEIARQRELEERNRQREYNRMVEQMRQQERQQQLQRGWNPQMGIRRDQYRGAIGAPPSTPPVYQPINRYPGIWLPGMPSRTNQSRIGSFAGVM